MTNFLFYHEKSLIQKSRNPVEILSLDCFCLTHVFVILHIIFK